MREKVLNHAKSLFKKVPNLNIEKLFENAEKFPGKQKFAKPYKPKVKSCMDNHTSETSGIVTE